MNAEDYKTPEEGTCRQGKPFERWTRIGWGSVSVLPFLIGRAWDDIALGYVHSLRPSHLRVVDWDDGCQLDAQTWRVTVQLNAKGLIHSIHQEVEIGLPEGVPHGAGMAAALKFGLKSPQVAWHNIPGTYVYSKDVYKIDSSGVRHDWPEVEDSSLLGGDG